MELKEAQGHRPPLQSTGTQRHRQLTIVAMKLAYKLLCIVHSQVDRYKGIFNSEDGAMKSVIDDLYSEWDSSGNVPLSATGLCSARCRCQQPADLGIVERAYIFYASLALWHLASCKECKDDCIVSHEMKIVFWVPIKTFPLICSKLYGVPYTVLKCSRPHGVLVGRKGQPLCLCSCHASEFIEAADDKSYKDIGGDDISTWNAGQQTLFPVLHSEDAGIVRMSSPEISVQSVVGIMAALTLAVAQVLVGPYAESESKDSTSWSVAFAVVKNAYSGVALFLLAVRGYAELLGPKRTMKDILCFRKEIDFFDDIAIARDQSTYPVGLLRLFVTYPVGPVITFILLSFFLANFFYLGGSVAWYGMSLNYELLGALLSVVPGIIALAMMIVEMFPSWWNSFMGPSPAWRAATMFARVQTSDIIKIRLLRTLMNSFEGPRLAASEGACYISNNCFGKYRFKKVTVADLKQCEPVIAGREAFVWVGGEGLNVCQAYMTSAGVYHIDRKASLDVYCTMVVNDSMNVA